jgi:chromate transporter
MNKNIELFWTFFKLGLFTFGGGYAMIPMMEDLIVGEKGLQAQNVYKL